MSRRPGIGRGWLDQYGETDVFAHDRIVIDGQERKVPRAYDQVLRKMDEDRYRDVKLKRRKKALKKDRRESKPDRLAVKEQILRAKLRQKTRGYESENSTDRG